MGEEKLSAASTICRTTRADLIDTFPTSRRAVLLNVDTARPPTARGCGSILRTAGGA